METYPVPSEQQAEEIKLFVVSRDEKDFVADVAVMIAAIGRKDQRKQSADLIANIPAAGCDASVVMCKLAMLQMEFPLSMLAVGSSLK